MDFEKHVLRKLDSIDTRVRSNETKLAGVQADLKVIKEDKAASKRSYVSAAVACIAAIIAAAFAALRG